MRQQHKARGLEKIETIVLELCIKGCKAVPKHILIFGSETQ